MKNSENLQNLLPFGYLYLVIMGILKESVFYHQLGINILKYSSIMDILISPVATLTANPIILIVVILFIILLYGFVKFMFKNRKNKWVKKLHSSKKIEELSDEEADINYKNSFLLVLALGLLSFFIGIGLGNGIGLSKKIEQNKIKYHEKLLFNTGETEQIHLINSNSTYYFYLSKGNKNVKITPIGSIKTIEFNE